MKYFVVSESELQELVTVATIDGYCFSDESKDVLIAEAACRSRPVPEWAEYIWATHEGAMQCIWQRPK